MIVGVLPAAGRGSRFGGAKLLHRLPDGIPVAGAAARRLAAGGVDEVVAVVRPGDAALAELLRWVGARVITNPRAHQGLGSSIATGVAALPDAAGWVIALADMPWIRPTTVTAVAEQLRAGTELVRPAVGDGPGHPVGFGAAFGPELRALDGDEGGRGILAAYPERMVTVPVADPGIHADVDRPWDIVSDNEGKG